jgi:hypothetical protein
MCAVTSEAVFCSSFMSHFSGMLLRYFLNDFEVLLADPVITDITFVFAFHMHCISTAKLSSSSSSSSIIHHHHHWHTDNLLHVQGLWQII